MIYYFVNKEFHLFSKNKFYRWVLLWVGVYPKYLGEREL